jgi:Mg2+-importing ATPase
MAPRRNQPRQSVVATYWALDPAAVAAHLSSGHDGLSSTDAARRLRESGPNELREQRPSSRLDVFIRQVRSPLLLLLVFAAGASAVTASGSTPRS